MQIVKEVRHTLCLSADDVRALLPVIVTGMKHSPARGFDVKRASPVVERLNQYLKEFGSDRFESE